MWWTGNANTLSKEVEAALASAPNRVLIVVLDFTLAVGIDSSAADTLLKIAEHCERLDARVCYCLGSEQVQCWGSRIAAKLEAPLEHDAEAVTCARPAFVAYTLDAALEWSENQIIGSHDRSLLALQRQDSADLPPHLWQLLALCPDEPVELLNKLLAYFVRLEIDAGFVLWRERDPADKAVLLASGRLQSRCIRLDYVTVCTLLVPS